jgi:hypothetical protein
MAFTVNSNDLSMYKMHRIFLYVLKTCFCLEHKLQLFSHLHGLAYQCHRTDGWQIYTKIVKIIWIEIYNYKIGKYLLWPGSLMENKTQCQVIMIVFKVKCPPKSESELKHVNINPPQSLWH